MEYMKSSFKPMFITMLPIIIVLGWMTAHLGFLPITAQDDFNTTIYFADDSIDTVTLAVTPENMISMSGDATQPVVENKATWRLSGPDGEYILEYEFDGKTVSKELIIDDYLYKEPEIIVENPAVEKVAVSNEKNYPIKISGFKLSWLWSYILISIVLNIITRKILKIH